MPIYGTTCFDSLSVERWKLYLGRYLRRGMLDKSWNSWQLVEDMEFGRVLGELRLNLHILTVCDIN